MFFGFGLIVLSYIILVVLGIWLLSDRDLGLIRLFIIPFLIWYGVIVYIGSNSMLGYPTSSLMKDGTLIVSLRIVEPRENVKGGFYFWGVPAEKIMDKTSVPRSFYLPYDLDLHKQLMSKKKTGNSLLVWRRNRKFGGSKKGSKVKKFRDNSIGGRFEILNPSSILSKSK